MLIEDFKDDFFLLFFFFLLRKLFHLHFIIRDPKQKALQRKIAKSYEKYNIIDTLKI
jgi:hypothetical protein